MKTLAFYGASDDLFLADVDGKCVEELCSSANGDTMAFLVQSVSEDAGLIVTGTYAPSPVRDGTWVIGITMRSETDEIPMGWIRAIETQPGTNGQPSYSPRLTIIAPDDVTITEMEG